MTSFLYDTFLKLSPRASLQAGPYRGFDSGEGWFAFEKAGFKLIMLTGWKFHISVDAADIPRAAEIVARLCGAHGVANFKMANDGNAVNVSTPGNGQAGKSFVLYDTGREDWARLLQDLEEAFEQARPPIEPVRRADGTRIAVKSDRPVQGSNYAYYRNDGNTGDRAARVSSSDADLMPPDIRYNPHGRPDPFAALTITSTRFNLPPLPFDSAPVLARQNWQRVTSFALLGLPLVALSTGQREALQQALTICGADHKITPHNSKGPIFEVACPDAATLARLQPLLAAHSNGQEWIQRDNLTAMRVDLSVMHRIEHYVLNKALAQSGIPFVRYTDPVTQHSMGEVRSPGNSAVAKLESLILAAGSDGSAAAPGRPPPPALPTDALQR